MSNPVISKFSEKPKTKIAWWAMGLGLSTLLGMPLLSFFAAVIRPMLTGLNEETSANIGINLGLFSLLVAVAAVIVGIIALRRGERSWLVWLGFILALFTLLGYLVMILADLLIPQ